MKRTEVLGRAPQPPTFPHGRAETLARSHEAWSFLGRALSARRSASIWSSLLFAMLASLCSCSLRAQLQPVPVISLMAGTGTGCSTQPCGENGPATSANLGQPWGMTLDNSGNLLLALGTVDPRIRKIDASGIITSIVGNGTACSSATASCGDGGPATSANLTQPIGVAVDAQGNIYIADQDQNRVRKVTAGTGIISTVAGTGVACSSSTAACGDGSAATSAQLNAPQAVVVDSSGNLYIADVNDNRVRKVTAGTGIISTIIGTGSSCTSTTGGCGDGAAATQASITAPRWLAFDGASNLYVAERSGQRVRELSATTGYISTVAGTGATCSSTTAPCGDGGAATSAILNEPSGIAFDNAGNLYISDQGDNRIRKVAVGTGVITTVVGTGNQGTGGNGGDATLATLNGPSGIVVSRSGDLYIGTGFSFQVRRVSFGTFGTMPVQATSAVQNVLVKTTAVETITSISVPVSLGNKQEYTVGTMTGCTLNSSTSSGTTCTIPVTFTPAYPGLRPLPLQIVTSAGSISFSLRGIGTGPQTSLSPGTMTTIAGTGTACSTPTGACGDGGSAVSATVNQPRGSFVDSSGNIWVADSADNRVRKISPGGIITTMAGTGTACSPSTGTCGDGGAATAAQLNVPRSVLVDPAGNVYIGDFMDNRVRMIAAGTQIISTVAGTGAACSPTTAACGDGGLATAAQLTGPSGLAMDGQGNLYIADSNDNRIRMLGGGYISTIAGTGAVCASGTTCGDGGPATLATFSSPIGIFMGTGQTLWIADTTDNRIRQITWPSAARPGQGVITTVVGTGAQCSGNACGDGGSATSATLYGPRGIVADAGGNLYIAETEGSRIRTVSAATQVISTLAGNGTNGSTGDNGPATAATVNAPRGLSMDATGNLIISDTDVSGNRVRKINVASSAFTFASTPYGMTSSDSPQTATLSNIGNAVLTFPVPASGQDPSISNNFLLGSGSSTACPIVTSMSSSSGTLPGGQSCALAISFAPQQVGSISGSLNIMDTALNNSSVTQMVALSGTAVDASPSATLVSNNNPSTYGGSVTFTATLGSGCTGSVSFADGGNSLGMVTISGNSASVTTSSLTGGSHNIVASYGGSANCNAATSPTLSQTVNRVPVTIAESSSLNPSRYGDTIQLTYSFSGSLATPTGGATVKDGASQLCTLTLDASGHASCATSALAVGSHTLQVAYNGDTNYY